MRVLVVGMNHRTAPLEVRERFAVQDPAPHLAKLVACEEIDEALLLSTCNRIEVVALTRQLDAARHRLRAFFHRELGGETVQGDTPFEHLLFEYLDGPAMRQVFRVAASLDSMVVGEPQILGQMKHAYRAAFECGACGPILSRLFQSAFAAAKRVRRETRIGERPVSVARVAVDLAKQIFESFEDKTALLVGAGEMIETALEALRAEGLRSILIANRTQSHAETLAQRFGATARPLGELRELVPRADIVLTCTAGESPVLGVAEFVEAIRTRHGRPVFVIDLGVPRNVDPAVNRLDGVYLYDIDDLAGVAASNADERRRETMLAEAIVLEEQQRFDGWLLALQAVPTIRNLRTRAEAIRLGELQRVLKRLNLDEAQRRGVESLTRSIVNKLLHAPVSRLRAEAEREEGLAYLEAARVLFALDQPEGSDAEAAGPAALDDVLPADVPDSEDSEDV